ncbi:MAG: FixH family protein [Bryobacteraceae bacterium]
MKRYIVGSLLVLGVFLMAACKTTAVVQTKEIQTQRAGDTVIALLNEKGELAMGKNQYILAFRSASNNEPIDVGAVTLGAAMAMPGMAPMTSTVELEPAGAKGQYAVKSDFAMSGAWKFEVRWDGPAGQGVTSFSTNVR